LQSQLGQVNHPEFHSIKNLLADMPLSPPRLGFLLPPCIAWLNNQGQLTWQKEILVESLHMKRHHYSSLLLCCSAAPDALTHGYCSGLLLVCLQALTTCGNPSDVLRLLEEFQRVRT